MQGVTRYSRGLVSADSGQRSFILGVVGYNELRVRRDFALTLHLFKLHNAVILGQLSLVPDRFVWRRRRPRLLADPAGGPNY